MHQQLMEVVLARLTEESCLVYIDDVIEFGKTLAEHREWSLTMTNIITSGYLEKGLYALEEFLCILLK